MDREANMIHIQYAHTQLLDARKNRKKKEYGIQQTIKCIKTSQPAAPERQP